MLNESSFCIRRNTSREETTSWRESIQLASCPSSPASKTASGTIAAGSLSAASPKETGRRCASRAMSSPSAIFTYARRLRATYAPPRRHRHLEPRCSDRAARGRNRRVRLTARLREPYAGSVITLLIVRRPDRVRAKTIDANSPPQREFESGRDGSLVLDKAEINNSFVRDHYDSPCLKCAI